MRRLGECFVMDSEPDSGHPTPRDFENIGDVSESPDVSISPLTSTPIAHRQRETSFHHYVQSETYPERVENSSSEIFVESAKQLILTTEKNRQLTKENERILNQTIIWNEEKCNLEKKLRDANMLSDSLRLEVETKNDKIYWLEKRLLSLSNVASDQATDEDCKVSVELRSEKKDVSIQCTPQDGNMNYARRKVSHEEPECWQEDCAFMEMENCEMRNDKKQFFREGGVKTPYYAENGEECKRLNEKINALQLECTNLSEVLVKNDELVKSLSNANMIIAMKEATECDLKLKLEKSEKQIHDLKNTIENMERIVDDKVAETKKLNEDCDKLQKMIGRLTDENVSITVSNEELKKRLSRANNEIEELQSSVANERKTCQAAQEASSNQNDLRVKLQEQSIYVEELTSANEKMAAELDFLRQKITTDKSKELERCSTTLLECQHNLEQVISEKKELLKKEELYKEEISKVESLRLELSSRNDVIMKLKCAEEELRDQLANKSVEITELRDNLSKANYEYSKLKEEFLEFQESAEHQYCATVKQKCDIIETIAARLEQLESYPGQVISTDSIHGNTVEKERGIVAEGSRTLYDCVSPSLLDAVERAGNISKDVADTVKLMQNTFIPIEIANMHNFSNLDQYEQQPQLSSLPVSWKQGFSYPLLKEESLLKQLINFLDNSKYCSTLTRSPDVRIELKNLLSSVMNDGDNMSMENAIYRFLEGCDKQFYECAMLIVDKEKKAICDEKQSVERKFSSEKIKWEVDRENLEQQLCRYRRQAEKIDTMRNEKTSIASELNAAKVQIDQYRLKLRQKSNELEQIIAERDIAVQLADEFKKLDQESQSQIIEANKAIDQLEENLKNARADLESVRRKLILLKDTNDDNILQNEVLKKQISDLKRKVAESEKRCDKLAKTEKYNQKTIQIVCESFWEREEFVQRLKQRSYERKKLIEHFVKKVGNIIATFSGDPHPVETMQATIKSWTAADVEDEIDNESREKTLQAQVFELGSSEQFDLAKKHVMSSSAKKP